MKKICFKIAFREVKSCLKTFKALIFCLLLGVTGITSIGSVRDAIYNGISTQSKEITGGDASLRFTYRFAKKNEIEFIKKNSQTFSELTDFRSMIYFLNERKNENTSLIQIKGIDRNYPLYGDLLLEKNDFSYELLNKKNGLFGVLVASVLFEKLDLNYGSKVKIGSEYFEVRGKIISEPDAASSSFKLGPRVIATNLSLKKAGLLSKGTMFNSEYKIKIKNNSNLERIKNNALNRFDKSGLRWSDHRNSLPGLKNFIESISTFLILIGISGLTLGGVGIASGISGYIEKNKFTIASLKSIGASKNLIFSVYLIVVVIIALLGIIPGLIIGMLSPFVFSDLISNSLSIPINPSIFLRPFIEALSFGLIISIIFAIFPLEQQVSSSLKELLRSNTNKLSKKISYKLVSYILVLTFFLISIIFIFSSNAKFTILSVSTIFFILFILTIFSNLIKLFCKFIYKFNFFYNDISFKLALSTLNNPRNEIRSSTIVLGLCLIIISTINLIDTNLRNAMTNQIPKKAPSFFFLDIQKDQINSFSNKMKLFDNRDSLETTPMLRGILNKINGINAIEFSGDHWVLKGDRGITFKDTLSEKDKILSGNNWDKNYDGFPLVSFSQKEANELGLNLGDIITLNILGRNIEAKIINFRDVDFSDMGINFLMVLNKNALKNAPYTFLSTVSISQNLEGKLLKAFSKEFPNITIVPVKEVIDKISMGFNSLITSSFFASLITVVIGFLVLIGTSATNERKYMKDFTIIKTLGCTKYILIKSYLIRTSLISFFTSIFSLIVTILLSFIFVTYFLNLDFRINILSIIFIILIGIVLNIISGAIYNFKTISKKISYVLKNEN